MPLAPYEKPIAQEPGLSEEIEATWEVCRRHRRSESVQALAQRFCQRRSRIDRIVSEVIRANFRR